MGTSEDLLRGIAIAMAIVGTIGVYDEDMWLNCLSCNNGAAAKKGCEGPVSGLES